MEIPDIAYQTARQMGLSHAAAAGILGNISAESSFDPHATNGTHTGLFQWDNDDRLKKLVSMGMDLNDPASQVKFAIQELGPEFIQKLNMAKDPTEAATIWENDFERSGGQSMDTRISEANKFATKYQGVAPTYDNVALRISDPNEPLDINSLINIGSQMIGNNGSQVQHIMQNELNKQAYHQSFAPNIANKFNNSDAELMKMALQKANADEEINKQGRTLTAAGKLAKMISESNSSSNAAQYAEFAKNLGINLSPEVGRFADPNALWLQKKQIQDRKEAEERHFKEQLALKQAGGRSYGGGGGNGGTRGNYTNKALTPKDAVKLDLKIKEAKAKWQGLMESIGKGGLGDPSIWKKELDTSGKLSQVEATKDEVKAMLADFVNTEEGQQAYDSLVNNDSLYMYNHIASTYPKDGSYWHE